MLLRRLCSRFPRRLATAAGLALGALLLLPPARAVETAALSNLSVRTTLAANQTLIVGGTISGRDKEILLRAGGPALTQFGLNGMADPRLSLFRTGSTPVATNDDWPASLASVFTNVGAFAFTPNSRDAALTQSLSGSFTAHVVGNSAGSVLVEAYDIAGGLSPRMTNLSARNRVGTGADILIAGFSISGTGTKKLLIRGVGPGLGAFGITGFLNDPIVRVYNSSNVVIATNDTWSSTLAETMTQVGAFALPAGSRDAALLVTLNAGQTYTVQVSGADGGAGEGLVEVYEVPDPVAEARLPVASTRGDVGLGFPRITNRLTATGTVRFKIVLVDFSDVPATRTPQSVFNMISPGSETLFSALSYGRMNVVLEPHLQWLRLSRPSTGYGWPGPTFTSHRAYIQEALNLAATAGVDFSTSDSFIVMANPDAAAFTSGPAFTPLRGSGVTVGGKTFENGATSGRDLLTWGYKWFNHEIGHALGLPDLYAFTNPAHRFVGEFSLMGLISGSAPEFLGWERWNLGWIDDTQVVVPGPGISATELTPLETTGGAKLIVIPTGRTTAVVVENRRSLGFDNALARPGVLAYFIDTAINSGEGVIKVLPIDETDTRHLGAVLTPGQSVTHAGVIVRHLSTTNNNATIEIARP